MTFKIIYLKKPEFNMKISIKPFKDYYPKFGIANVDMTEFKKTIKYQLMSIKRSYTIIICLKKII